MILLALGVAGLAAWGWGAWWAMTRPGVFAWTEARSTDAVTETWTATPPPADIPPIEPAAGPNGEMIRAPSWRSPPRPEFPDAAMRAGIREGTVELRCEVLASGELGACEVMSATAEGVGFAESALAAAREARLWPRTIDDVPTDASMTFSIRYRLDEEGARAADR